MYILLVEREKSPLSRVCVYTPSDIAVRLTISLSILLYEHQVLVTRLSLSINIMI